MTPSFLQILLIILGVFLLFRINDVYAFLKNLGKGVKAFKDEIGDQPSAKVVSLSSARKTATSKKTAEKKSVPAKKPAAKKVSVKKTPGKAVSAKKTTVKKATAKKTPAKKK